MPLYEPRRGRPGSRRRAGAGRPDPAREVDRVASLRNPIIGMSPYWPGRWVGYAVAVVVVSLLLTIALVARRGGFVAALDLLLGILLAGAAGVLILAAILLGGAALVFLLLAPARAIGALRRWVRRS